jgi:hypothetical protein
MARSKLARFATGCFFQEVSSWELLYLLFSEFGGRIPARISRFRVEVVGHSLRAGKPDFPTTSLRTKFKRLEGTSPQMAPRAPFSVVLSSSLGLVGELTQHTLLTEASYISQVRHATEKNDPLEMKLHKKERGDSIRRK